MLHVLNASAVDMNVTMDQVMRFGSLKCERFGSMCRSWHVLERKDFDVVNQHRGGDIDCSSLKTCSKF